MFKRLNCHLMVKLSTGGGHLFYWMLSGAGAGKKSSLLFLVLIVWTPWTGQAVSIKSIWYNKQKLHLHAELVASCMPSAQCFAVALLPKQS